MAHPDRLAGGDFRFPLLEWISTSLCHQWFPAIPLDTGLETCSGPIGGIDFGFALGGHFRY
jgi:hypothetical protein